MFLESREAGELWDAYVEWHGDWRHSLMPSIRSFEDSWAMVDIRSHRFLDALRNIGGGGPYGSKEADPLWITAQALPDGPLLLSTRLSNYLWGEGYGIEWEPELEWDTVAAELLTELLPTTVQRVKRLLDDVIERIDEDPSRERELKRTQSTLQQSIRAFAAAEERIYKHLSLAYAEQADPWGVNDYPALVAYFGETVPTTDELREFIESPNESGDRSSLREFLWFFSH
jgi:hypothetical protein